MVPEVTQAPATTWAERARWALPILCGVRAILLLTALTAGSVGAAGLCLIACYGLIERKAWGSWLAGSLAVVCSLWDGLSLLALLVGRSEPPALLLQGLVCAIDLALCAGILALLLIADSARRPAVGR
jgi:hypothetical protein